MNDDINPTVFAQALSPFNDWAKREQSYGRFFLDLFARHNVQTIFDSCLGHGFDTSYFLRNGFDVLSNEVDPALQKLGVANLNAQGFNVKLTTYDWRFIPSDIASIADALTCNGNSFTYNMTLADRVTTMQNFYRLVRDAGIIHIDSRNYDYMLRERRHILANPRKNFRYSKKYIYCGEDVDAYPVVIRPEKVVLEYFNKPTGLKAHLTVYPLGCDELVGLVEDAGFNVLDVVGDFGNSSIKECDFYHVVAKK